MSFTALKEAGVEPAKTDADQVRILRPLWVDCRRPGKAASAMNYRYLWLNSNQIEDL
jgi:hypothetical protein